MFAWAHHGPTLQPPAPPPPALRIRPHVVGPGTTLTCEPAHPGEAVRWTIDGVDAGVGSVLVAPPTVGALVRCQAGDGGDGNADRVVVGTGTPSTNVLLVLLDDVGIDKVGTYHPRAPAPPTPTLDALAAEGVRFANVWSGPICSPTRASVLTGLDATDHGIGRVIDADRMGGLRLGIRTLPMLLRADGWQTGLVGKWHVTGEPAGLDAIHRLGFESFQGSWGNLEPPETRYNWGLTGLDGRTHRARGYDDVVLADLARTWLRGRDDPWFLWLAFHGAHAPWEPPPAGGAVPNLRPSAPLPDRFDAVLTAVDRELGRVLDALTPEVRARTTVVVLGDNGTAWQAVRPPYPIDHAKGTVYELGVHVPMFVTGPLVPPSARGTVAEGLVSHTDLLPTLLEATGHEVPDDVAAAIDGVSFVDLLARPDLPARRSTLYSEMFEPRDVSPPWRRQWSRAIRDERWTLVESLDSPPELYDLVADPLQRHDLLLGTPSPEVQAVRQRLHDAMWREMAPQPAEVLRPPGLDEGPPVAAQPARHRRAGR